MAKSTTRRGSFRSKVVHNSQQQRRKESSHAHLRLPRGISVFKEEAGGRVSLDILPYFVTDKRHPDRDDANDVAIVGGLWYKRPYFFHYRPTGASGDSVVCPTSIGKKCPICEYRTEMLAKGMDWKDKEIVALRASLRNLYYVVPKESKKFEEKPYLWDISNFCFQSYLDTEIEENDELGDFPDLENGFTLSIRFSEEKLDRTSFAKVSRIDFNERSRGYDEDVIKNLPSLDDVLDIKDYKEVDRLFYQIGDDEASENDYDGTEQLPSAERSESVEKIPGRSELPAKPPRESGRDDQAETAHSNVLLGEHSHISPSIARPALTRSRPQPSQESEPEVNEQLPGDDNKLRRRSEPEQEAVLPRQRASSTPTKTPVKGKPPVSNGTTDECPSGYEFGVDVDSKPECEDCPVWGDCMDAKQAVVAVE